MGSFLLVALLATTAFAFPTENVGGYNEIRAHNEINVGGSKPVTMSDAHITSGGYNMVPEAHLSNTNIQMTSGSPSIVKTGDVSMGLSNAAAMKVGSNIDTRNFMLNRDVPFVPVVRESIPTIRIITMPSSYSSSSSVRSSSSADSSFKRSSINANRLVGSSASLPSSSFLGTGFDTLTLLHPVSSVSTVYEVPVATSGLELVGKEGIAGFDFGSKGSLTGMGLIRTEGATGLGLGIHREGVSGLAFADGHKEGISGMEHGFANEGMAGLGIHREGLSGVNLVHKEGVSDMGLGFRREGAAGMGFDHKEGFSGMGLAGVHHEGMSGMDMENSRMGASAIATAISGAHKEGLTEAGLGARKAVDIEGARKGASAIATAINA